MTSSISRQLILWLSVPLTLLALAGGLVHYFNNVAPQVISTDRRLKETSHALAARLQVKDGQVSLAPSPGNPQVPASEPILYAVRDAQLRLLAGDARLPVTALAGPANAGIAVALIDRRSMRLLSTRVDTPAGPVTVTVARDVNTDDAARFGFMSTLLWDFVQLDLTLVLIWVGIQQGLRPLRKLREEIAERSPLDLRPIVESNVPREIAPLAATLNRLFSILRSSVQSQQQFIADTAHQLRTPITGLLAQLELLAAEPAAAPVKNRLMTLQDGVRQLAHSANQLLALARADPTVNVAAKNQTVELHSLAGEVVARFFDRALLANIDLGADLQPVAVLADPSLLDDLVSNLVDNALKYSPAGGRVTVCAGRQNGRPFLAVEDDGRGIPEAERQRVRQRFYRLPNSPGHGSGLGLAIVEEIARLYDASVSIAAGANGVGTRVSVHFPAAVGASRSMASAA